MAARTTISLVQAILGDNYGPLVDGTTPDLQQFIDTATVIVDRVRTCAIAKNLTLTHAELELIERWLSAHFYAQMDLLYQKKETSKAKAEFQGTTGMMLESTRYGQSAINLDYSGCLMAISKRQFVSMTWLGKPPSTQIDYDDRS